ncbi:putative DNA-binding domain-containing protein [Alteromonas hispanica]|uniref:DUF2063 domain-containing protein n=1 Tax=Alteromonas hispanica TaxID=315421 RepID=A0A6L9MXU6_9ALTE|nr:DUF2063 domain-containing protein [Alteromonas sp.]NDW23062.1 DUF2063 domain-containing protein [Alteromonas hispanica]
MKKSFEQTQYEFVHAIKNPKTFTPKNDEEARRVGVYQALFFSNIDSFVSSAFPVLKSIIVDLHGIEGWQLVVRQFFSEHECRSPYFNEISKEFVEYLSINPALALDLPEFSAELAHYEWLELDVQTRKNSEEVHFYKQDDSVEKVRVSPLATLVSYSFPVHLIGTDFLPTAPSPEPEYYVVYRDAQHHVHFAHLNAVTALLVHTLEFEEQGLRLDSLAQKVSENVPHIPQHALIQGAQQTVVDMLKKGILIAV